MEPVTDHNSKRKNLPLMKLPAIILLFLIALIVLMAFFFS